MDLSAADLGALHRVLTKDKHKKNIIKNVFSSSTPYYLELNAKKTKSLFN